MSAAEAGHLCAGEVDDDDMRAKWNSGTIAGCLLLACASLHAAGANDSQLALTVSQTSLLDDPHDPVHYGVEYHFGTLSTWKLRPVIGITTAGHSASFVYADLRRDFRFARDWSVTPSFGLGRFDPDDVLDLGTLLEFRTGVAVAYHFPAQYRLELGLYHFSNGGIAAKNPGTEALVLSFGIPLD